MILLMVASALTVDGAELDALGQAVAACDRATVARSVEGETRRHATFLLDAVREQREIAAARVEVAARRRTVRAAPQPSRQAAESELSLGQSAQAAEDRQQALDDQRRVDGMQQEAANSLRQLYLTKCQGKGA